MGVDFKCRSPILKSILETALKDFILALNNGLALENGVAPGNIKQPKEFDIEFLSYSKMSGFLVIQPLVNGYGAKMMITESFADFIKLAAIREGKSDRVSCEVVKSTTPEDGSHGHLYNTVYKIRLRVNY